MPPTSRSRSGRGTSGRSGFALVEFLTACCILVIVMGVGVSLARHVRAQSARVLTADLLVKLETLAELYAHRNFGQFPVVTHLLSPDDRNTLDRQDQLRLAIRNNRAFLQAVAGVNVSEEFRQLPLTLYDPQTPSLRDAWGTPILFMPRSHPLLGMAPADSPFFISAGPDHDFFTRADNLYSYDTYSRRRISPTTAPSLP
jgi:hypothetical protein